MSSWILWIFLFMAAMVAATQEPEQDPEACFDRTISFMEARRPTGHPLSGGEVTERWLAIRGFWGRLFGWRTDCELYTALRIEYLDSSPYEDNRLVDTGA
jgi:hypothetical protein